MGARDVDMDGETVTAGDTIAFSFGIPPRRVEGILFERDGQLIMPTPDVTPNEASLKMLRKYGCEFYKVGKKYTQTRLAELKGGE